MPDTAKKPPKPKKRRARTDKFLRDLALDAIAGRIFMSDRVRKEDLHLVFLTLALLDEKQTKRMLDEKVTHLYEYMNKAAPLQMNGMPMFYSHWELTLPEYMKFREYETAMVDAVKNIKLKTPPSKKPEKRG